jgi:hypothetical protein
MPRKPVPTLSRTVMLAGIGKIEFTATANLLTQSSLERARLNKILDALDTMEINNKPDPRDRPDRLGKLEEPENEV